MTIRSGIVEVIKWPDVTQQLYSSDMPQQKIMKRGLSKACHKNFECIQLVQISMDGPSVNWEF